MKEYIRTGSGSFLTANGIYLYGGKQIGTGFIYPTVNKVVPVAAHFSFV